MNLGSITPAAIATVATNGLALAVAFGVSLSMAEREAILAFTGSLTSLVFVTWAAVHAHHVGAAVKLAAAQLSSSSSSPAREGSSS